VSTSMTDLTVADVLLPSDKVPVVGPKTFFKQTLEEMGKFRLGIACVVDSDGVLLGIFTDGDIRRRLLKDQKPFSALFADDTIIHTTVNPTTTTPSTPLVEALEVMEGIMIWDLPVVDEKNQLIGLLHLHPAIKAVLAL
jgi:CBS domain-containing protein